ncbi:MAG: sugar isomerase domain-containing protein [Clostridiales bacterium]|jgi:uncharacterized phosphosugar-binding protein|nr:sugar isomerase domain-containing protein [Clostridiales bacterium]
MMLMDQYFEKVQELMETVMKTQREKITNASSLIYDALKNGGAVHVYDTGHIINSELIHRAGGLALLKPLRFVFNVDNPVRQRDNIDKPKPKQEGFAKYVLTRSNVAAGDVLIIGSVSGKSAVVIDLALSAKEMGVKVIVLTSVTYSSSIKSEHSSGKRLFEVGDIVIDNCAPVGDAMLSVEGLDVNICPASGLSAAFIMWALTADLIEKMLKDGIVPSVYKSVNLPDGPEYNKGVNEAYNSTGY